MHAGADPYRGAPARREPPVVVFRHLSPRAPWIVVAVLTALLVLVSHRVELVCDRTSGECVAWDQHVAWTSGPVRVAVASLRGAAIVRTSKNATKIALRTPTGQVFLSGIAESTGDDEKRAVVDAVERFAADPSAARLEVAYGSRWADSIGALAFILPFAGVFLLLTRRVRVTVDRAGGLVAIERSRYPLSPATQTLALSEVAGAEVEVSSGGRGGSTYRVALVRRDGDKVPLTTGYSSGKDAKERCAEAIRAALRDEG
jgi:hypothetical protein